jgi:hypothetical protein
MATEIIKRGPLFDGRAKFAMDQYVFMVVEHVAEEAEKMVKSGTAVFKNPTGAYESRINAHRVSRDRAEVWDNNSVYGPWLEGVGSRNRTTRFKGYHFWRKSGQQAQRLANQIANRYLQPYLRRMQ